MASRHIPQLITPSIRALLGEGPVWDERSQLLFWVDIDRGELHRCRADGSQASVVRIGERIGCVALRREQPGLIAGLERRVASITLEPLCVSTLATLDPHAAGNRCNDGKCDPAGRFWVGTSDPSGTQANAWLFRFDGKERPQQLLGPCICSNGPAFSPDGRMLYFVDSYARAVYACGLSPSGELSEPRVFKSFDAPGWGYPDGLTCDAQGCLWIAHWGGARVSRFDPAGELLDAIHMPVLQPSSCTFGGEDLHRLFITSASVGLTPSANANGLAGAVFAVDLEIGGLPAARFDG
jgi:xylono-1,5-lactonase